MGCPGSSLLPSNQPHTDTPSVAFFPASPCRLCQQHRLASAVPHHSIHPRVPPFQPGLCGQMGEKRQGFTPSLLLAVTCCLQTVTCGHRPCPSSADQLSARVSHLGPGPHLVLHPVGSSARPRRGWGIRAARKESPSPGRLTKSLLLREPPSEVPEDSRVATGFWQWSRLIRVD